MSAWRQGSSAEFGPSPFQNRRAPRLIPGCSSAKGSSRRATLRACSCGLTLPSRDPSGVC